MPHDEVNEGITVEDVSYEPLEFLSGIFRGSQLRWAAVDKGDLES